MDDPELSVSRNDIEAPAIPPGGETADKWTVMGIMSIGLFMATLDASIVNISLPKISLSFHVPLSGMVEWVIIAYLLVISGLLLTLGRMLDMVGQKLLWVLGLFIFTTSSALCGAAPSLTLLVIFRALQAVGGAMIMAISPVMITRAFPFEERGRALGILGLVLAAGTSAGPTVGVSSPIPSAGAGSSISISMCPSAYWASAPPCACSRSPCVRTGTGASSTPWARSCSRSALFA
jgi:MFS family permease